MADPGFPRGGGTNPKGGGATYNLANFSRKLQENEEILGQRGEGARGKFRANSVPFPLTHSNISKFILFSRIASLLELIHFPFLGIAPIFQLIQKILFSLTFSYSSDHQPMTMLPLFCLIYSACCLLFFSCVWCRIRQLMMKLRLMNQGGKYLRRTQK